MRKKIPKILIIWLIIMIPIHMCIWWTQITDTAILQYHGFGVDVDRNIYVGEWSYIKVYSPDGEELRQISSETSRGYDFCIVNGDTIHIKTGSYFYIKNLNGDILEEIAITDENRHALPRIVRRTCVLPDGTTYIWRSPWFRMTVYRLDSTTYILRSPLLHMPLYRLDGWKRIPVFQSPMSNYWVVLLAVFYFVGNAVMIPVIVRRWKKLNPSPEEKKALNDESMKTTQELIPIYSHRTRQEQSGNINMRPRKK